MPYARGDRILRVNKGNLRRIIGATGRSPLHSFVQGIASLPSAARFGAWPNDTKGALTTEPPYFLFCDAHRADLVFWSKGLGIQAVTGQQIDEAVFKVKGHEHRTWPAALRDTHSGLYSPPSGLH